MNSQRNCVSIPKLSEKRCSTITILMMKLIILIALLIVTIEADHTQAINIKNIPLSEEIQKVTVDQSGYEKLIKENPNDNGTKFNNGDHTSTTVKNMSSLGNSQNHSSVVITQTQTRPSSILKEFWSSAQTENDDASNGVTESFPNKTEIRSFLFGQSKVKKWSSEIEPSVPLTLQLPHMSMKSSENHEKLVFPVFEDPKNRKTSPDGGITVINGKVFKSWPKIDVQHSSGYRPQWLHKDEMEMAESIVPQSITEKYDIDWPPQTTEAAVTTIENNDITDDSTDDITDDSTDGITDNSTELEIIQNESIINVQSPIDDSSEKVEPLPLTTESTPIESSTPINITVQSPTTTEASTVPSSTLTASLIENIFRGSTQTLGDNSMHWKWRKENLNKNLSQEERKDAIKIKFGMRVNPLKNIHISKVIDKYRKKNDTNENKTILTSPGTVSLRYNDDNSKKGSDKVYTYSQLSNVSKSESIPINLTLSKEYLKDLDNYIRNVISKNFTSASSSSKFGIRHKIDSIFPRSSQSLKPKLIQISKDHSGNDHNNNTINPFIKLQNGFKFKLKSNKSKDISSVERRSDTKSVQKDNTSLNGRGSLRKSDLSDTLNITPQIDAPDYDENYSHHEMPFEEFKEHLESGYAPPITEDGRVLSPQEIYIKNYYEKQNQAYSKVSTHPFEGHRYQNKEKKPKFTITPIDPHYYQKLNDYKDHSTLPNRMETIQELVTALTKIKKSMGKLNPIGRHMSKMYKKFVGNIRKQVMDHKGPYAKGYYPKGEYDDIYEAEEVPDETTVNGTYVTPPANFTDYDIAYPDSDYSPDNDGLVRKSFGYRVTVYRTAEDGEPKIVEEFFGDNNPDNNRNESVPEYMTESTNQHSITEVATEGPTHESTPDTHELHGNKRGEHHTRGQIVHQQRDQFSKDKGSHAQEHMNAANAKDHYGRDHKESKEKALKERTQIEFFEREQILDTENNNEHHSNHHQSNNNDHHHHDQYASDSAKALNSGIKIMVQHPDGSLSSSYKKFNDLSPHKNVTNKEQLSSASGHHYIDGSHPSGHSQNGGDNGKPPKFKGWRERGYKIITETEFISRGAEHDKLNKNRVRAKSSHIKDQRAKDNVAGDRIKSLKKQNELRKNFEKEYRDRHPEHANGHEDHQDNQNTNNNDLNRHRDNNDGRENGNSDHRQIENGNSHHEGENDDDDQHPIIYTHRVINSDDNQGVPEYNRVPSPQITITLPNHESSRNHGADNNNNNDNDNNQHYHYQDQKTIPATEYTTNEHAINYDIGNAPEFGIRTQPHTEKPINLETSSHSSNVIDSITPYYESDPSTETSPETSPETPPETLSETPSETTLGASPDSLSESLINNNDQIKNHYTPEYIDADNRHKNNFHNNNQYQYHPQPETVSSTPSVHQYIAIHTEDATPDNEQYDYSQYDSVYHDMNSSHVHPSNHFIGHNLRPYNYRMETVKLNDDKQMTENNRNNNRYENHNRNLPYLNYINPDAGYAMKVQDAPDLATDFPFPLSPPPEQLSMNRYELKKHPKIKINGGKNWKSIGNSINHRPSHFHVIPAQPLSMPSSAMTNNIPMTQLVFSGPPSIPLTIASSSASPTAALNYLLSSTIGMPTRIPLLVHTGPPIIPELFHLTASDRQHVAVLHPNKLLTLTTPELLKMSALKSKMQYNFSPKLGLLHSAALTPFRKIVSVRDPWIQMTRNDKFKKLNRIRFKLNQRNYHNHHVPSLFANSIIKKRIETNKEKS